LTIILGSEDKKDDKNQIDSNKDNNMEVDEDENQIDSRTGFKDFSYEMKKI